jgi:tetratricopeptide (TPR) repeat protein
LSRPDQEPSAPLGERRPTRAPIGPPPPPASRDEAVAWLAGRAEERLHGGFLDEAMPYLQRLLELARETHVLAWVNFTLGELWRERDELGRSTHHFRAAVELEPERAELHYQLGLAQARQENAQAAVDALRRALALAPRDPEVLRALGVALAALGEDAEASELLGRALRAAPEDVRVLESVAAHYLKMGRFGECAEVLERAGRLDPENRLVRRLTREAGYLVELASQGPPSPAAPAHRRSLRLALSGAAGEVERLFLEGLGQAGFTRDQRLAARDLWRDYLERRRPRLRRPAVHAAAVHHAIARLDFMDGSARDDVALTYGVRDAELDRAYGDIVDTLDVAVFDPRYCSQSHPVAQVEAEAQAHDLEAEEVLRALLEDEYREYEEAHAQSGSDRPRLDIEEFEDASIEYGALLTREMMGITLGKRDRRRKRELERLLLVAPE